MADEKAATEIPRQASQRGLAGITPEAEAVREQIRAGEVPDAEEHRKASNQAGYDYPIEFYKPNPAIEVQKQTANYRGLPDAHKPDAPDKSDPAYKASQAAAKEGQEAIEADLARRAELRTAAETPAPVDPNAGSVSGLKQGKGASENKAARKR